MAKEKLKTVYVCTNCGEIHYRWQGQCSACHEWNTLVEDVISDGPAKAPAASAKTDRIGYSDLSEINASEDRNRIKTGISELDRVLGGGIVKGSGMLIGGEPGAGKSTLLLQVCGNLSADRKVIYITGEESPAQIKLRANRLGIDGKDISIAAETDAYRIASSIESLKPDVIVIDSIQTMNCTDISSSPGSVSQVRECTSIILSAAKKADTAVFIVSHVNKDGAIAGPKVLEHIVDTVLYFEGDKTLPYRILRASKNRYGSTNEIGMFDMTGKGIVQILNPSMMLLEDKGSNVTGSCVTCVMEGSRPILTEIQSLAAKTSFAVPRRTASGVDYNRLNLQTAVLEKRAGISLSSVDIYLNVVGGLDLEETSIDLAMALSIYSSVSDRPIPDDMVVFGEVGLGGEIRNVTNVASRLNEIQRLGFRKVIMPKARFKSIDRERYDLELYGVSNIKQAIALI